MKRQLLTILLMMVVISSYSQSEQIEILKKAAFLDSTYFAEMMSRRTVDEFTNEITIDCPVLGNPKCTIHLLKKINSSKTNYFLVLMAVGSSCVVDGKGLIILFSDGTKLTKLNEKINVDVSNNGFSYTALIPLTFDDLKILSSKIINKFRLYIFDGTVNTKDAEDFKIYSKNIVRTK